MNSKTLLKVNGAYLALMGTAAATADAAGHFLGKGPFGDVMFNNPLTIGAFEAHLLAAIVGVLLWKGAASAEPRLFHTAAAGVHAVLGGSNLLFFEDAFGAVDLRIIGVVVTGIHAAWVIGEGIAAARAPALTRAAVPRHN